MRKLRQALAQPIDPASLIFFRIGFGLLAALSGLRFVWMGWVEELLLRPSFHFTWLPGLPVPSEPVLYGLFLGQILTGIGIALGWRTRLCLTGWLACFGYVELLDKTLYLNHYVLFTLLGVTLWCAPPQGGHTEEHTPAPAWLLWLLRFQVAMVYFWAGVAKLNADWIFRAEPLQTWLSARADLAWVGPMLAWEPTAYLMSWAGALYDLTIPILLLIPATRWFGFSLVVLFHMVVGALFPIGIFPWLMVLCATLFLDPSWPRRNAPKHAPKAHENLISPLHTVFWMVAVCVLALFPARTLLDNQNVNWTEDGYRFSWRVMLNEKTGLVDFHVTEVETGRTWTVMPSEELTALQHKQMRTQPDMIRDYAIHLKEQHRKEGRKVTVSVDSWASLNGRPAQRMIRPDVDLTLSMDELERANWIVKLQHD